MGVGRKARQGGRVVTATPANTLVNLERMLDLPAPEEEMTEEGVAV